MAKARVSGVFHATQEHQGTRVREEEKQELDVGFKLHQEATVSLVQVSPP